MARSKVVQYTCDRCNKVTIENDPDPDAKRMALLALGGRLIPELLATAPNRSLDDTPPPSVTLDDLCADCQKRVSDLVKQILYRTFKTSTSPSSDNAEAPVDTGTPEVAESTRANRSKRNAPTTEEKGS